jgi:hypothetical protein
MHYIIIPKFLHKIMVYLAKQKNRKYIFLDYQRRIIIENNKIQVKNH